MENYFNDKNFDGYNFDSYNEGDIVELSLENLEEISGGRIKAAGYAALLAAIKLFKNKGYDREYAINAIMKGWDENCPYRVKFTDGTDADREATINYIKAMW